MASSWFRFFCHLLFLCVRCIIIICLRMKDLTTSIRLVNEGDQWTVNCHHTFLCVCVCVCVWLVSSEECSFCLLGPWGGRGLLFSFQLALGVEGVRQTALPRLGPGLLTICGGVYAHDVETHTHARTVICTQTRPPDNKPAFVLHWPPPPPLLLLRLLDYSWICVGDQLDVREQKF